MDWRTPFSSKCDVSRADRCAYIVCWKVSGRKVLPAECNCVISRKGIHIRGCSRNCLLINPAKSCVNVAIDRADREALRPAADVFRTAQCCVCTRPLSGRGTGKRLSREHHVATHTCKHTHGRTHTFLSLSIQSLLILQCTDRKKKNGRSK